MARTEDHQARAQRRQQILDGLFEAMAQSGTANSSITEIARAAGIARGALHYYFDSKDAIRLALMQALGERYAQGLHRHLDRAQERFADAPRPALRALVHYHFGGDEKQAARLMGVWIDFWGQAPHDDALSAVVQSVQEKARQACQRVLFQILPQAESWKSADQRMVAAALLAQIEGGLLQWRVARHSTFELPREALASTLEDALFHQLAGWGRQLSKGDPP
jgi:AcrR family transcriptional regulator